MCVYMYIYIYIYIYIHTSYTYKLLSDNKHTTNII